VTTKNSKTKRTAKRKKWTPVQIRMLKKLAGEKHAKAIGRQTGHTESATRQKAFSIGVSLDTRKAA
jgi:hypothetical protein